MESSNEYYERLKLGQVTLFVIAMGTCNPNEIKASDLVWMKISEKGNAIPAWRSRKAAEIELALRELPQLKVIEITWSQIQQFVKPHGWNTQGVCLL